MCSKKKILVIDDDRDILEALQLVLEEKYDLLLSTKAEEALPLVKNNPDCVLLDLLLSGSNGKSIAQQIKNTLSDVQIPIIIMSAQPVITDSLKEYGVDYFLSKPFDIDTLHNLLQTIFRR